MKKFILLLLLLALVLSPAIIQAQKDEKPALGLEAGTLVTCIRPLRPEQRTARAAEEAAFRAGGEPLLPIAPLEETFLLHSYPSSNQKLFIDFDGFDAGWAYLEPWSIDGDDSTFNDEERIVIQRTWQAVAEDFRPFNIDVTTEDPGISPIVGQRAVVDGGRIYGYSFANYGDWARMNDREAYVFPGDNTWEWICHSISHEVGHTVNLSHDGSPSDGGYYKGHGTGDTQWCPIMGWGAWSLNTWDDGEYYGTTNPNQDDLATIAAVTGLAFRPDDHGDIDDATAIVLPPALSMVAEGVISDRNDDDYFAFTTLGGNVRFSINGDAVVGSTNLDILAKIYNSSEVELYTSNPVDKLSASFFVTLPAGDYYLSIEGVGVGDPTDNPPTGYSNYGSLGYYSIKASKFSDYACGDMDGSGGNINLMDFSLFANCWGENPSLNESCVSANLVEWDDHVIDLNDLQVFCGLFLSSSLLYAPNNCSASITDPFAPTPGPMTFATAPEVPFEYAFPQIYMVATTATDISDVEYYFTCTAGGGNDSGWQASTIYQDTGLLSGTTYTYTVKARDLSDNFNETAESAGFSATFP